MRSGRGGVRKFGPELGSVGSGRGSRIGVPNGGVRKGVWKGCPERKVSKGGPERGFPKLISKGIPECSPEGGFQRGFSVGSKRF